MAKTPKDDDKKRREEAAAMKQALSEERQEQLRRTAAAEALVPKKQIKEKSKASFICSPKPSSKSHEEDWKKIVADFEKQFHHGLDKDGVMQFASMKDATDFFKKQAEQEKRCFFATECKKGKMLDHHFYSCGDGHLYEGTYLDIEKQLVATVKSHPEDTITAAGLEEFRSLMPTSTPNPATEMREHIKDQRGQTNKDAPVASPGTDTALTAK